MAHGHGSGRHGHSGLQRAAVVPLYVEPDDAAVVLGPQRRVAVGPVGQTGAVRAVHQQRGPLVVAGRDEHLVGPVPHDPAVVGGQGVGARGPGLRGRRLGPGGRQGRLEHPDRAPPSLLPELAQHALGLAVVGQLEADARLGLPLAPGGQAAPQLFAVGRDNLHGSPDLAVGHIGGQGHLGPPLLLVAHLRRLDAQGPRDAQVGHVGVGHVVQDDESEPAGRAREVRGPCEGPGRAVGRLDAQVGAGGRALDRDAPGALLQRHRLLPGEPQPLLVPLGDPVGRGGVLDGVLQAYAPLHDAQVEADDEVLVGDGPGQRRALASRPEQAQPARLPVQGQQIAVPARGGAEVLVHGAQPGRERVGLDLRASARGQPRLALEQRDGVISHPRPAPQPDPDLVLPSPQLSSVELDPHGLGRAAVHLAVVGPARARLQAPPVLVAVHRHAHLRGQSLVHVGQGDDQGAPAGDAAVHLEGHGEVVMRRAAPGGVGLVGVDERPLGGQVLAHDVGGVLREAVRELPGAVGRQGELRGGLVELADLPEGLVPLEPPQHQSRRKHQARHRQKCRGRHGTPPPLRRGFPGIPATSGASMGTVWCR